MIDKDFKINNFIFPLITFDPKNQDEWITEVDLCGTGFLINNLGYGLTASHVIKNAQGPIGALFINNLGQWVRYHLTQIEYHPAEDVCVFKLANDPDGWRCPFTVTGEKEYESRDYRSFGYPADLLLESPVKTGVAILEPRPKITYAAGYIRRRVPHCPINGLSGTSTYELSDVMAKGCSGSPLFYIRADSVWVLIGIYLGARQRSSDPLNEGPEILGYGCPSHLFAEWEPTLLGQTIKAVSANPAR